MTSKLFYFFVFEHFHMEIPYTIATHYIYVLYGPHIKQMPVFYLMSIIVMVCYLSMWLVAISIYTVGQAHVGYMFHLKYWWLNVLHVILDGLRKKIYLAIIALYHQSSQMVEKEKTTVRFLVISHKNSSEFITRLKSAGVNVDARNRRVRITPDILNTATQLTHAAEIIVELFW